jgi:plastocyanin
MHTLAAQLAPVLAAEKSKVPFYVAGGVLVAWALFLSLGLGMRRANFPANQHGQRAVMAISALLVVAALVTAVITSGGSKEKTAEAAEQTQSAPAPATESPPAQSTTETPAATGTASAPASTTTPAPPAPEAASTVKLAAASGAQLAYDTKALSAKAGAVTIDFSNSSPLEHDVVIAEGSKVLGQTPTFAGGSKSVALTLKPGKYTFYCSVPGHRQAGMEGTLTIS